MLCPDHSYDEEAGSVLGPGGDLDKLRIRPEGLGRHKVDSVFITVHGTLGGTPPFHSEVQHLM